MYFKFKKSNKKTGQNKRKEYTTGVLPKYKQLLAFYSFNMENFKKEALQEINDNVYRAWNTLEILDEGRFYYKIMFIGTSGVEVNENNTTIIKVLEISNTEFNEDNQTYRFSLEELVDARAFFLQKQKEKEGFYNNLFSKVKIW